jgi:Ca2+-binding EF-hand superfamily protein
VKAFATLDENHTSHLTPDNLKHFMMEEGEPFTQEEVEEMLKAATDPEKDVILYRDYVTIMLPEQEQLN